MKPKELIKLLEKDGWYRVPSKGGHLQFKHPIHVGKVTVPNHPSDIPTGTLRSIEKQAKWR